MPGSRAVIALLKLIDWYVIFNFFYILSYHLLDGGRDGGGVSLASREVRWGFDCADYGVFVGLLSLLIVRYGEGQRRCGDAGECAWLLRIKVLRRSGIQEM